jgi:hypothetical protein
MINTYDFKPAVGFMGSINQWRQGLTDVILLNILEIKLLMMKENMDIEKTVIYGHHDDLKYLDSEKINSKIFPNFIKRNIPDGMTSKVMIEITFFRNNVEYIQDSLGINREKVITSRIIATYEIKLENNKRI